MGVRDIVQEIGTNTIPRKKKCTKTKWLSEEALQVAEKRREAKGKGEKERYAHLNAEFQKIARRDKKALLSDQCKEIEENHRMGKIRDLFKKIRDTNGIFQAKMGTIKDRKGMEDIKERWQEYTEELYKKDLNHPDNHDGVITHLEPDVLKCEVKWALGSITINKASGGDGTPAELFQSAALSMPANLENSAVATGLEKVSFHSKSQRRAMPKNAQTTAPLHSSHMLAK